MKIKRLISCWWARRDWSNPILSMCWIRRLSNSYPMFAHEQKQILSKNLAAPNPCLLGVVR